MMSNLIKKVMPRSLQKPTYNRILLKLSGEALQEDPVSSIDSKKLVSICQEIAEVIKIGVQVGLVIGGGNFVRGVHYGSSGIDRVTADQMGMLGTIMNGLALRDVFNQASIPSMVMSALAVPGLVDVYDRAHAEEALKQGKVVIFTGGTGNPLVTTDSAAALRGIETKADIVIKATKVDGVYAADPIKNPKAIRYDQLTFDDVIEQRLGVMDLNAILLCRDHGLPIRVFNMNKLGGLLSIVLGEAIGTLIQGGD